MKRFAQGVLTQCVVTTGLLLLMAASSAKKDTLTVEHFDSPRHVKNAQCILLPMDKPNQKATDSRVICSGTVGNEFQLWTEPIVLPTRATVTIEPSK